MEKNDELLQEIALSLNDNPNIYPEDYQIDHKDDEAINELLKNNNQGPEISLKKEMEVNSHPDNLNLLSQKENSPYCYIIATTVKKCMRKIRTLLSFVISIAY